MAANLTPVLSTTSDDGSNSTTPTIVSDSPNKSSLLSRLNNAIHNIVLVATPYYAMLCHAKTPKDYDVVLEQIAREVKFHCETVSERV